MALTECSMSWRSHGPDVGYANGARLANKGLQMTHPNVALFVAESCLTA